MGYYNVLPNADAIRNKLNQMCPGAHFVGLGTGIFEHEDTMDSLGEAQSQRMITDGARAYQTLVVSGVVADEQTVTIGDDVYEVDQINTDVEKDIAEDIDDETVVLTFEMEDDAHGLDSGDLIVIGTEAMLVMGAEDEFVSVIRGWGTDLESHTTGADVFESAAGYTTGRIPVPAVKTTLTAESFIDAFVIVMDKAKELGMVDEDHLTAYKLTAANLLLMADGEGVDTTATTEVGTNMDWNGDALVGGHSDLFKTVAFESHTVETDEIAGVLHIPIDQEPETMTFQVTRSGAPVAWDGTVVYAAGPPKHLIVTDGGTTNLEAGDIVSVIAIF